MYGQRVPSPYYGQMAPSSSHTPAPTAPTPHGSALGQNYTRRLGGFEVEHTPNRMPMALPGDAPPMSAVEPDSSDDEEIDLPTAVQRLMSAKARPIAVGGKIPLDPANLVLFFHAQSGVTHSLNFPIDPTDPHISPVPPAFDVLLTSCIPLPPSQQSHSSYTSQQSTPPLTFAPGLPFSTTLELANRPILAAVQNALFPGAPPGMQIMGVRERLDVLVPGSRVLPSRSREGTSPPTRVATLLVTLPVKFRGGDVVVRSPPIGPGAQGQTYRFHHSKKSTDTLEWVAWLDDPSNPLSSDLEVEVESVRKGMRVDLRYGVYLQPFGSLPPSMPPAGPGQGMDALVSPPEDFRGLLGSVLNHVRGRRIGVHLGREYGVNPAENVAEALIPRLSGGDLLLYESLRTFDLSPILHWTAGGYIWPADAVVDMTLEPPPPSQSPSMGMSSMNARRRGAQSPPFNPYALPAQQQQPDEVDRLKMRVEAGGASALVNEDILILSSILEGANAHAQGPMGFMMPGGMPGMPGQGVMGQGGAQAGEEVGKERVPFVNGGELGKLVVNCLLVVYIA